MRKAMVLMASVFLVTAALAGTVAAADLEVFQNLSPGQPPLDVAVSRNGKWVYVLSDSGTIFVYAPTGELKDQVAVGAGADRIAAGLRDDLLYVSNHSDGTVKMVRIDLVHDIPIAGAPFKGPADAPVTIVVFTDFQCPYCAKASEQLDQVAESHPKTVKLVYKNFPLRNHAYAFQAAAAALAADRHGKFWAFHDRLFAEYNRINPDKIREIAKSLGFSEPEFSREAADPKIAERIQQDVIDGRNAGVMGTPTIFVNGRLLQDRSPDGFEAAIARELKRAGS
ncbi:MAG: thioredoxin domain-containing protein [Desulfobacterales bacterium]|jgi:protein-disulfide isomerase